MSAAREPAVPGPGRVQPFGRDGGGVDAGHRGQAARAGTAPQWLVPIALLGGLAAIVTARWVATRGGIDPLAVGTVFGLVLAVLAVGLPRFGGRAERRTEGSADRRTAGSAERRTAGSARRRVGVSAATWPRTVGAAASGVAFGLVLVAVVAIGAAIAGAQLVPGLGRPAADFAPWAAVTLLVASAQEALLRGRLFDAIRRGGGVLAAVAITTIAFALMHVPLYGWHVVPLDLAVGLAFAGLRLATGTVLAPAAAHSTADLATWWL